MDENIGICGRLDILESELFKLQNIVKRKKEIERCEQNIKISHILEKVLSIYLLYGINKYENTKYLNWYDIPYEVYNKYKIDKNELIKLKIEQNDEYYLEKQDIISLVANASFSEGYKKNNKKYSNLIYNVVTIFFNLKSFTFKFDYLRKKTFNKVNNEYNSEIYQEHIETLYEKTDRLSVEISELKKEMDKFKK